MNGGEECWAPVIDPVNRSIFQAFILHHHKSRSFIAPTLRFRPVCPTVTVPPANAEDCRMGELETHDLNRAREGRASTLRNVLDIRVETDTSGISMRRVLLVEDDDRLRTNYETLLAAHQLSVKACATKADAMVAFAEGTFDVIILDVTLGSDSEAGFELCQAFREKRKTAPIIFLTDRSEDHDRISGLRLGADDYLVKTISGPFLVARINALIRRVETLTGAAGEAAVAKPAPSITGLRIDERLSQAFWRGKKLDLSLTQFWILKDLFDHMGEVRSTSDLMRAARVTVQPNTIVVHIKAIREEIMRTSPDFACIKAERARGYRWVDEA
jgi:two-component system, OmpR family, response regulator